MSSSSRGSRTGAKKQQMNQLVREEQKIRRETASLPTATATGSVQTSVSIKKGGNDAS